VGVLTLAGHLKSDLPGGVLPNIQLDTSAHKEGNHVTAPIRVRVSGYRPRVRRVTARRVRVGRQVCCGCADLRTRHGRIQPATRCCQSSIIVPVADIYKAGQPPVGYMYYDSSHSSDYLFIRTHFGVTVGSITDVVRSDWYPTAATVTDSINSHNCHDYSTSWIGYADNGHLVGGDRAISPDASIIDVHCLEDYSIIVGVPVSYDTWRQALTLAHTHTPVHQESGFGLAISACPVAWHCDQEVLLSPVHQSVSLRHAPWRHTQR